MDSIIKKISNAFKTLMKHIFRFSTAPRRQWRIVMILMVAVGMVIVAFHIYLFYLVQSHKIFFTDMTVTAPVETVNEPKLRSILERFQGKALMRTSAMQLIPAVTEPSR